jgi:hypothetical protein
MAQLIAGSNLGITNYPFLDFSDVFVTSQQPNQFIGGAGDKVITFTGSGFGGYTANGFPTTGLISAVTEYEGSQKLFDLTGIAFSAQQLLDWNAAGPGGGSQFEGDATVFSGSDYLQGSNGNDTFFGYAGNDVFRPQGGSNLIDGGTGLDVLQIAGARSNFAVTNSGPAAFTVSGPGETDLLFNTERIHFFVNNQMIGLDVNGTGGQAYRLYQAAFDRTPDEKGLGFWIDWLDQGKSDLVDVSARFIDSPEFRQLYGPNPSTQEFVTKVYENVLNRAPDAAGLAFYVNQINSGQKSEAKVLADFSESPENQGNVNPTIANGFNYDLWLGA